MPDGLDRHPPEMRSDISIDALTRHHFDEDQRRARRAARIMLVLASVMVLSSIVFVAATRRLTWQAASAIFAFVSLGVSAWRRILDKP